VFLPDGNHYFYTVSGAGVYLADLQNSAPRKFLGDVSSAVYVSGSGDARQGYVLFLRNARLMAQPFDEGALEAVGDPFVLVNDATADRNGRVAASASTDGTLVYIDDKPRESQLTWMDRSGMVVGTLGSPGNFSGVGLSPKGNYAVARRQLFDLVRGRETSLTPSGATNVRQAVWSEDESSVLITMTGAQGPGLYRKEIAAGKIELIEKATDTARWDQRNLSDWSRDGKLLIYTEPGKTTQADIWSIPMEAGRPAGPPAKLVATDQMDSQGQLSPDGKWLAYVSGDFLATQVMIQSLHDASKSYTVSGNGFQEPRFAPDGNSLYFFRQSGQGAQRGERTGTQQGGLDGAARQGYILQSVSLKPDGQGGLRIGAMESLPGILQFTGVSGPSNNIFKYSPHRDGRFLVIREVENQMPPTIQVLLNSRRFIAERQSAKETNP
jgi:hypothetical protein